MDGWKTIVAFWGPAHFQVLLLLVSGEGKYSFKAKYFKPRLTNIFHQSLMPQKTLKISSIQMTQFFGVKNEKTPGVRPTREKVVVFGAILGGS